MNKKLLAMLTFFILESAVVYGMPSGIPMCVEVEGDSVCADDNACAFENGPIPQFHTRYMQDGDRNCKIITCRCKGAVRTIFEESTDAWGKKCFRYDSRGEDYFEKIFDTLLLVLREKTGLIDFDKKALIKRFVFHAGDSFIKKYTVANAQGRPYEKTLIITTHFNEKAYGKQLYVDIIAEVRELPLGLAREKRWQFNCCGINRCCFFSEVEENI